MCTLRPHLPDHQESLSKTNFLWRNERLKKVQAESAPNPIMIKALGRTNELIKKDMMKVALIC